MDASFYLDGIVVHVRGENQRVSQHTIYVALGVNLEGKKELLGLWLSQNEGAKFWPRPLHCHRLEESRTSS